MTDDDIPDERLPAFDRPPLGLLDYEPMPYEKVPYALWVYEDDGSLPSRAEEAMFVLHRDPETEYMHVMLFEDLDTAYKTRDEFKAAVGRDSAAKRTDVRSIGEDFHLRLYRADGTMLDLSRKEYLRGMEP